MTVLASALALGAAYGLLGVAVSTVAVVTRTLHLAVGAVLVAGVLVRLLLGGLGLAAPVAVAGGVAVGALLSASLEPLLLRPLARPSDDPDDSRVLRWLVGLAVAAAVIETATGRWLATRQFRPRPLVGGDGAVHLAGVELPAALPAGAAVGAAAALLLAAAVRWTRWGRRLRLVGGCARAATLGGIRPPAVRASALAVSGAVAVLAGLLIAPVTFVGAGQAADLTVRGVAAGALLSAGGPARALLAGVLLGLAEAAGQSLQPAAGGDLAVAATVVTVLAVRGGGGVRGHAGARTWDRAW